MLPIAAVASAGTTFNLKPVEERLGLEVLLPAEARLLLLTLDESPRGELIERELAEAEMDWERLLWLANREKASSRLWEVLKGLPADTLAPEQAKGLQRVSTSWDIRMLHLQGRLVQVLSALKNASIEVVLLKGAGLAVTAYRSFAERQMYDLDLLVRAADAERAWETLRNAGWTHDEAACPREFYEGHHHLPPLDDSSGTDISVEFHTAPWSGAVELSPEEIWRNAREVQIGAKDALVPCINHQMLHLATHFAWGHGMRAAAWRTFRDLHRLTCVGEIDWESFVDLALETRGGTCCYWTLLLARNLADVQVPDSALERLRPPLPRLAEKTLERHFIGSMFHFGAAQCPSDRIGKLLWSAAIAPRRSGHGDVRPWSREPAWTALSGAPEAAGLKDRLRHHADRLSAWRDYLAAVVQSPKRSPS